MCWYNYKQSRTIGCYLHQYAYTGKGRMIHSSTQLEMYKNQVDDYSQMVGGNQYIQILNGYIIPLDIQDGLPYMPLCAPTDNELDTLPSIILTSNVNWDPHVVNNLKSNNPDWTSKIKDPPILLWILPLTNMEIITTLQLPNIILHLKS